MKKMKKDFIYYENYTPFNIKNLTHFYKHVYNEVFYIYFYLSSGDNINWDFDSEKKRDDIYNMFLKIVGTDIENYK